MEHKKIERINELAKLSKARALSTEELIERDALRKEYIAGFRENMQAVLESANVQQPDGTIVALKKKENKQ